MGADGEVIYFFPEGALGRGLFFIFGLQDQGNIYTTRTLHLSNLFPMIPVRGIIISRIEK